MHTVFGPSGRRGIYALSMANHRPDPRDTGAFPLTAGGHQGVTRTSSEWNPYSHNYFFWESVVVAMTTTDIKKCKQYYFLFDSTHSLCYFLLVLWADCAGTYAIETNRLSFDTFYDAADINYHKREKHSKKAGKEHHMLTRIFQVALDVGNNLAKMTVF